MTVKNDQILVLDNRKKALDALIPPLVQKVKFDIFQAAFRFKRDLTIRHVSAAFIYYPLLCEGEDRPEILAKTYDLAAQRNMPLAIPVWMRMDDNDLPEYLQPEIDLSRTYDPRLIEGAVKRLFKLREEHPGTPEWIPPMMEAWKQAAREKENGPGVENGGSILVLDTDEAFLEKLIPILREAQAAVKTVSTPEEFDRQWKNGGHDLGFYRMTLREPVEAGDFLSTPRLFPIVTLKDKLTAETLFCRRLRGDAPIDRARLVRGVKTHLRVVRQSKIAASA